MSIENYILAALPVVLGAILAVSAGRDWRRKSRARREMTAALEQRWDLDQWAGKLGNGWEKR